jgi:apolipoprotein N-acyltransferase
MPRKIFLTLLFGALLGLSWPTAGFTPLIFIAFVPLLLLFDKVKQMSNWSVFGYFAVGFFIWNAITTWWLWNATVFGMFFAMLLNTFLMSSIVLLWKRVDRKLGVKAGLIFLPLIWICFEKLHLNWDFSWPWLNLGNVFSEHPNWVQWYEYTGVFGGTLWVWLVNISAYKMTRRYVHHKKIGTKWFPVAILLLIPLGISFGIINAYQPEANASVTVTVVQPNIDPYTEKYDRTNEYLYAQLLDQIRPALAEHPELIVTPETYFSEGYGAYLPQFEQSKLYRDLLAFGTRNNVQFLSGMQFYNTYTASTKSLSANKLKNGVWADFYNSAFLTDTTKVALYHKSKLVAGVETLPFRNILEPLLGNVMLDFGGTIFARATQKERAAFRLNSRAKVGPIICYESVYGAYVTEYVRQGATFLAIITNDAWWGNTPGHRQHLSYARLRAIETRRPIVRAANTGISGFISPLGAIANSLAYNTKGVATKSIIPQKEITFYTSFGDYIYRLGGFVAGLMFLFTFGRKKN